MNFTRTLAREICLELGIEWDEQSLVPTVRGVPAPTPEELFSRFPEEPKPKEEGGNKCCPRN